MFSEKIKHFCGIYRACQKGTAAIEFALLAIPFLMAIFGIMEAARIMYTNNSAQYALEEVSRQISLNEDMTAEAIEALAKEKLNDMKVNQSDWDITTNIVTNGGADFIEIIARAQMSSLMHDLIPEKLDLFTIEATVKTALTD